MSYKNLSDLELSVKSALLDFRRKYYSNPIEGAAAENDALRPGYLIVLGINPDEEREIQEDHNNGIPLSYIRNGKKHPLVGHVLNGDTHSILERLSCVDGAIMIDSMGVIHRIGARLLTEKAARKYDSDVDDEWMGLGFYHPTNTRHINAALYSMLEQDALVITMSGKTGDIRTIKNGKIIESTIPEETMRSSLDARFS